MRRIAVAPMVEKQKNKPLYYQISEYFKNRIKNKQFCEGECLPPISAVAKEFKVNYRTIRQAYQTLENFGLVKFERGKAIVISDSEIYTHNSHLIKGNIAVVSCNPDIGSLSEYNYFAGTVYHSLIHRAGEMGYTVQSVNLRRERGLLQLINNQWSGIIFAFPSTAHTDGIPFEKIEDIPKVFLSLSISGQACVRCDDEQGIKLIMEHLYQLGHRKIAFVFGPARDFTVQVRLSAYLENMNRFGLTISPNWIVHYEDYFVDDIGKVEKVYYRLFRTNDFQNNPTAIVCVNYFVACGLLRVLHKHNIKVPEEVSVVGYDDPIGASFTTPPLTTIRQPLEAMGRVAIELLENLIEGGEPTHKVLPVKLIVRASTAHPAERS